MINAPNPASPEESSGTASGVEAIYRAHYAFLNRLAQRSYRVPPDVAENLVQEAFASFAAKKETIHKVRPWLVSAVFNGCRYYWRCRAREEPLPPDIADWIDERAHDLEDRILTRLAVRQAIAGLGKRCQGIIRLRFYDQLAAREMAVRLKTTKKYAEKLLYDCFDQVREIYLRIAGGPS